MNDKSCKEVFVPLYISNECDSVCKICNLRKTNKKIIRKTASQEEIENQLYIIFSIERIRAVCILTGEHSKGENRKHNLDLVIWSINKAIEIGFEKIYINIGALSINEITLIKGNVINTDLLILSLFQETYCKDCYMKFFSENTLRNTPKEDFDFRYQTYDRWMSLGFKSIDLGILVGLSDIDKDLYYLIMHAKKLRNKGAEIYISLPRIIGLSKNPIEISDEYYMDLIRKVKVECPWAKLIITSRENVELIKKLLPYVDVISPGCSDITPYTTTGKIINSESSSQFVVKIVRDRPSEFLNNFEINLHFYRDN